MSQNSFIKQYLAKQQELLRQRLEKEAREAAETDGEYQMIVQIVFVFFFLLNVCNVVNQQKCCVLV